MARFSHHAAAIAGCFVLSGLIAGCGGGSSTTPALTNAPRPVFAQRHTLGYLGGGCFETFTLTGDAQALTNTTAAGALHSTYVYTFTVPIIYTNSAVPVSIAGAQYNPDGTVNGWVYTNPTGGSEPMLPGQTYSVTFTFPLLACNSAGAYAVDDQWFFSGSLPASKGIAFSSINTDLAVRVPLNTSCLAPAGYTCLQGNPYSSVGYSMSKPTLVTLTTVYKYFKTCDSSAVGHFTYYPGQTDFMGAVVPAGQRWIETVSLGSSKACGGP